MTQRLKGLKPNFKPWLPGTDDQHDRDPPCGPSSEEGKEREGGSAGAGEEDELEALLSQYEAEAADQTQAVLRKEAKKGKKPGMVQGREQGLATPIGPSSIGHKLLKKMGYKEGEGIGKSVIGMTEPLKPEVRPSRGGLGVHEGAKRKREEQERQREEEAAAQARRQEVARQQFKDSSREGYQRRQALGHLAQAWKVCEQLECSALARAAAEGQGGGAAALVGASGRDGLEPVVAGSIPAEFAGVQPQPPSVRIVELMRRLPALWVPAEGGDDGGGGELEAGGGPRASSSGPSASTAGVLQDVADDSAGDVSQQLHALLCFLRDQHCYCLFCGCTYQDEEDMRQHCPGGDEDDH